MKKQTLIIIALLYIAALSASALPSPGKDEMTIKELAINRSGLEGKVVETEITGAYSLEGSEGKYQVFCVYYKGTGPGYNGESVNVGEEGKEFFEELIKQGVWKTNTKTIYIFIENGKFEALGTRFKKSKGAYRW